MPANDGLGLDDHQRPLPIRPATPKDSPESSIEIGKRRPTLRGALRNRELMAQGQVLEGELAPGLEGSCQETEQHSDKAKHGW